MKFKVLSFWGIANSGKGLTMIGITGYSDLKK